MMPELSHNVAHHMLRNLRFLRGLVSEPKSVGAIAPTSVFTARRMAAVADPHSDLPVLELGPGTGVLTRALLRRGIAPERIVAVEYSSEFCRHLRRDLPGITVLEGDAFDLDRTLDSLRGHTRFDCVVSGLPLLNFPVGKRIALLQNVLGKIPPGRPMVQFSYGLNSPIPERGGRYRVTPLGWEIRNVPPARMWLYHRSVW